MPWPAQGGIAGVISCLPPKFRGEFLRRRRLETGARYAEGSAWSLPGKTRPFLPDRPCEYKRTGSEFVAK